MDIKNISSVIITYISEEDIEKYFSFLVDYKLELVAYINGIKLILIYKNGKEEIIFSIGDNHEMYMIKAYLKKNNIPIMFKDRE